MNNDGLSPALASLARELDDLAAAALGVDVPGETDAPPELPGSDYHPLRCIGRGGMGAVYEAEQRSLGRHVAVKILPRNFGSNPERVARFVEEARLVARLHHPGIVPVFGVGEAGGLPYFAMELVKGVTAGAYPLPDARAAVSLLLQAADALVYAHTCGVCHGDVKPANLLVSEDGRVRLADFGLAAVFGSSASSGLSAGGTMRYLAPEVRSGGAATPAADQFALGITLRELCPGDPGRELGAILAKATAENPADRYAGMAELAADLRRYLHDEPVQARPASAWRSVRLWSRRNPVAALLALASVLATSLAVAALAVGYVRTQRALAETHREAALAAQSLANTLAGIERGERDPRDAELARALSAVEGLSARFPGDPRIEEAAETLRRARELHSEMPVRPMRRPVRPRP